MRKQAPLISCICITSNRPLFLQRAIACFERQDYPNKELIVSHPENDTDTKSILDQIENLTGISFIRLERTAEETIGMARNNAIEIANGSFICFWDDDDWYASNRISEQYKVLKDGPFKASILMHVLIHDTDIKESYCSLYHYFEGSLLCEKKMLSDTACSNSNKKEVQPLILHLISNNTLYHILDQPQIYIYIYHGQNALGEAHFNYFLLQSSLLRNDTNEQVLNATDLSNYSLKNIYEN
jgi:glycosyltransferase involved in cell wall biosynthesis